MEKSWQKKVREEAQALKNHSTDLEAKLTKALSALEVIAKGSWYSSDGDALNANEFNMRASAAGTLKRIAQMQQRPKPNGFYL